MVGFACQWCGKGFQWDAQSAIKFVDTEPGNRNTEEFYIGLLREAHFNVRVDPFLGDAALIGNDSMHGVYCQFRYSTVVIMGAWEIIGRKSLLSRSAECATRGVANFLGNGDAFRPRPPTPGRSGAFVACRRGGAL